MSVGLGEKENGFDEHTVSYLPHPWAEVNFKLHFVTFWFWFHFLIEFYLLCFNSSIMGLQNTLIVMAFLLSGKHTFGFIKS